MNRTINFDDYPLGSTLPVIPGITFVPGAFGSIDSGSGWGSDRNPGRNNLAFSGLEIIFDAPVSRLGFVFGGNTDNSVPVELEFGGAITGGFTVTSDDVPPDGANNWLFYGFEDLDGIDKLRFGPESNNGWIVGIYDIVYETMAVSEPGTLTLLGLGLLGLGASRRKKAS